MANSYKTLFQGQLSNSVATLATVGAGKQWIIKLITVVNNDGSARTFSLYLLGTAATNIFTPTAISIPAGGCAINDDTITIDSGGTIAGVASVASQLTITIEGDEVS